MLTEAARQSQEVAKYWIDQGQKAAAYVYEKSQNVARDLGNFSAGIKNRFFGSDASYRAEKAAFALKNLKIRLAKETDAAKRAIIQKQISTVENCMKDVMKCAQDTLMSIYDFANTAVDMADDFCDHRIVDMGNVGFEGPTNCDLARYGLNAGGFLSRGAGWALTGFGAMFATTGVGAPIGAGLIGAG